MNLANLLKSPSLPAMREALAKVESQRDAAVAQRDELLRQREEVYLQQSDTMIAKHQQAIAAAEREADKLSVQFDGLARRVAELQAEAEADEERQMLEAAEDAAARAAKLIRDTYARQARALAATLREIRELEIQVDEANEAIERGDLRQARSRIATPMARVAPPPDALAAESVTVRSVLPDPNHYGGFLDGTPHIWPEAD